MQTIIKNRTGNAGKISPRRVAISFTNKIDGKDVKEESLTKQSDRDSVDLNLLVKRARGGEILENVRDINALVMGDFSQVQDYDQALNAINAMNEEFAELPSHIRNKFENNPQKLVEFIGDNNNYDEAVELGLIKRVAKTTIETANVEGDGTKQEEEVVTE